MAMPGLQSIIVAYLLCVACFKHHALSLVCPSSEDMDADVLIFGGGVAGITIAQYLYENGITNIKVLEARNDSIGGRVRSKTFSGSTVEVGANWIHQVTESEAERSLNPLWKLAKDTQGCANLQGKFTETAEFWSREGGNSRYSVLSEDRVDSVQSEYDSASQRLEGLSGRLQENEMDDITLKAALEREGWAPKTPLENLIEWFNVDFSIGESPNMTSLFLTHPISAAEPEGLGEGDYLISDQRGFATFLDCIIDGIESKIQLGAMVNNISWNSQCVCASVTINNREPETMCGKYGIVTFSIGVLQEWINPDNSRFTPPLSTEKQEAIRNSRMTHYLKIFLHFDEVFWNTEVDQIMRVDNERGHFPVIQPVGALYPGSPGIILVTVVESEAVRLSRQDPEETKNEIMVVLRELYGNEIPDATDILVPTWFTDPLYRGMYATVPFGLTMENQLNLAQPEGNLYFSGDGVSREYKGSIQGAYCQGLVTAQNILEAEGRPQNMSDLPMCPTAPSSAIRVGGMFVLCAVLVNIAFLAMVI